MRRVKSMLLTVLCMGLILGAGYFVIVESGQKVLEKERVLEESSYEDTSSNIFYGKIEENIELFPWSYYPEEGEERILGEYPRFQEAVLGGEAKDFEEELKKFKPSLEVEEAEDAIYDRDLTDMTDIMQEILKEARQQR